VGHAVIMLPLVRQGDEGLDRRVASSPSPQQLSPLGVLTILAEHASHLCVCFQTSVEITHIYQI
jgi:hypothetical protein